MKSVSIILNFIIIVIAIVLWLITSNYEETVLHITVYMAFVSLATFVISNKECFLFEGQYLRVSYLFIIGFFIVFFQYNIDLMLGNISVSHPVFASSASICTAALLSVVGLSSFVLGNTLALAKLDPKEYGEYGDKVPQKYIFVQKILLLTCVLLYLYFNMRTILSGSYVYSEDAMKSSAGSLSNYSVVMVQVFVFTILSSNAFNIKISGNRISPWDYLKSNGLLFNIPVGFYLILVFMTGDRGPVITILMAYIITYIVACKKKISLIPLLFIVIGSGTFLSIVGDVRRHTNLLTIKEILSYNNTYISESFLPATQELAGSYKTFTYTVEKVPSSQEYFCGMMQLRNLGYSVPFLYRLIPFVYSSRDYENGSTSYCTYLIQGLDRKYGNGTSLLADIYLDFGIMGIIILMIWLGAFITRLDYELFYGDSLNWMLVSIVCFSYSVYLSRSTLVTPIYFIVPALLIVYCRKYFSE